MARKLNLSPPDITPQILIGSILIYPAFVEQTVISNDVLPNLPGIFGAMIMAVALYAICPDYQLANLSTYMQHFNESTFSENPEAK